MKVENGSLVQVEYRLSAEDRGVFGGTRPGEALQFVFGEHRLPLDLDQRIKGLESGGGTRGTFVMPKTLEIRSSDVTRMADSGVDQQQLGYSVEEVRGEVTVVRPTLAGTEVAYSVRVLDVLKPDRSKGVQPEFVEVESEEIEVLNGGRGEAARPGDTRRVCACHMSNCFLCFGNWLY